VTLFNGPAALPRPFHSAARYGPCNGQAADRAPDESMDMGTGFDCFDSTSRTADLSLTSEQRSWRRILVAAVAKRGFGNYHREW
jgi:D-alanyl-D-alanine dipeptidase